MPVAQPWSVSPDHWVDALAQVARAVAVACGVEAPGWAGSGEPSDTARAIAAGLASGERKAVLLGQSAAQHPAASELLRAATFIAACTGAQVGYLGEGGNSVGAQIVGALPSAGARDARSMLDGGTKGFVLLNVEPGLDFGHTAKALKALSQAATVIALSAYKSAADVDADVLLPIAAFTETSGSYVNAEGRLQTFHGVVKSPGEARPAWKVLRVLGSMLGLPGFEQASSEDVLRDAIPGGQAGIADWLDNAPAPSPTPAWPHDLQVPPPAPGSASAWRIADVPIYATDAIVRRSGPLQATADARVPVAAVGPAMWAELGLVDGDRLEITGVDGTSTVAVSRDASVASGTVRIAAGHPATTTLGPMFGAVRVKRIPAAAAAPAA
jgi:NADH-quinone oxidoreductase subunit G